ncbi:PIN domain-like protein [Microdochium bolleyi]|uniref:PIN domain-like protein n=1 Tax=Microdochium bolleyi TaxID=196109 RepID=A0A136J3A1_9PEZI|nr:PIN domain-like protein [Microdochium bolleyi]
MGLKGFWAEFGSEETTNLFQRAAQHFKQHARPFRVAVDFACWYNHSVGREKTQGIREETGRLSNPIEKNSVLYPAIRCVKHGMQLVFVFDGKARPNKRGRTITPAIQEAEDQRNELAKSTLRELRIPCHDAPGEAEAECVALERAGVVDAVWTDDSDAFMFGARTVIRHAYEVKGGVKHKSNTQARLYTAADIAKRMGLPDGHDQDAVRDALKLYAILVGSDYNVQGVIDCGPKKALTAMRNHNKEKVLWGTALVKAYKTQRLAQWKQEFEEYCMAKGIQCPTDSVLNPAILRLYIEPKVSSAAGLTISWTPSLTVSTEQLISLLVHLYNFSVHDYLRVIAPMFLVTRLLSPQEQDKSKLNIGISSNGSRKESGNSAMFDGRQGLQVHDSEPEEGVAATSNSQARQHVHEGN